MQPRATTAAVVEGGPVAQGVHQLLHAQIGKERRQIERSRIVGHDTKHLLGGRIERQDSSGEVQADDGVGRGVEQRTQLLGGARSILQHVRLTLRAQAAPRLAYLTRPPRA